MINIRNLISEKLYQSKANEIENFFTLDQSLNLPPESDSLLKSVPQSLRKKTNTDNWNQLQVPLLDGPNGPLMESIELFDLPYPCLNFSTTNALDTQKSAGMKKENYRVAANPIVLRAENLCLVRERSLRMPLLTAVVPRYKFLCGSIGENANQI